MSERRPVTSKAKPSQTAGKVISKHRRAGFDYFINESLEVGLVLTGTEIKSLRTGRCSISESYVRAYQGELFLCQAHIGQYAQAGSHLRHDTLRARKLLLHRRQLKRIVGAIQREGVTAVPLDLHFNHRNFAKMQLGLARGKRKRDKRAAEQKRDWLRSQARILRSELRDDS